MSVKLNYEYELRKCISLDEIMELMKGKIFTGSKNSKFEDDRIVLQKPDKEFLSLNINLKNKFLRMSFRIICFLKYDGFIESSPTGSGRLNYHSKLGTILSEIEFLHPQIKSFEELDQKTIDIIIETNIDNSTKQQKYSTLYSKIYKLLEWARFANDFLPFFMKIDENIIINSKKYITLKKNYNLERLDSKSIGSNRRPYNLISLKELVGSAIDYLENYSEDVIEVAKNYMDSKKKFSTYPERYEYLFDCLNQVNFSFSEPNLKRLKDLVIEAESIFIYDSRVLLNGEQSKGIQKRISVSGIMRCILNCCKKLEACCVIIILMTTGMRKNELVLLERNLEIINDEYHNLKRIIYKTADSEDGFEHTMPIPSITKKAIEILSKLNELKDGKKKGKMIVGPINFQNNFTSSSGRLGILIDFFADSIGLDLAPTPHQFRHAIAFLITYVNQKDGLELARMFLGHTSITMTLQYMGHYNLLIKKAINELHEEEGILLVEQIINEIKNNRKLYGVKGEMLIDSCQFKGSYADEFSDLINKSLLELINKGKLAIIQTPISICMHDLTKPEKMACQRGFEINNYLGEYPKPSRCEGANCSNSIFTESHVEKLKIGNIEKSLKDRLEKNRFFIENGGFDNDPYSKIINKYEEDKKVSKVI